MNIQTKIGDNQLIKKIYQQVFNQIQIGQNKNSQQRMNNLKQQIQAQNVIESQQMKNKIICVGNKISTNACFDKACLKYSFVCNQKQCKCRQQHKDCLIVQIGSIIKTFLKKLISTKQIEESIDSQINQMIDYLSDLRQNLLNKIKSDFQHLGLNHNQKLLIKSIEQGNVQKLTGSIMFQAYKNIEQQITQQEKFNKIQKSIQKLKNQVKLNFNSIKQKINTQIQHIQKNSRSILQIYQQSIIITQKAQQCTLQTFFSNKKTKSYQLLFRASQNQFSLNKFHQKCDNIPNTLFVILTEFGKKIGAYTPLCWQNYKGKNDKWVKDQTKQSFIFSLTNKDKFFFVKQRFSYITKIRQFFKIWIRQ